MPKKTKLLVLSLIPLLLLGFLAIRAFKDSAAYYYGISEVLAEEIQDKKIRIKGKLVEDSVDFKANIPLLKFSLTDGTSVIDAVYPGFIPDNFEHADELIIEGKFNSQTQFVVSKLMLQCPSKYEGED